MNEHVKEAEAQERVSHKTLDAAMSAMQAELLDPIRDKKVDAGKLKFQYADLEGVLKSLRPVLHRHGLWISRHTEVRDGMLIMVAQMRHESGERGEPASYPVSTLNANHQQIGAGMTYAQRRLDSMVAGISSTDDNDTQGTGDLGDGPRQKMSVHQAKQEINWDAIQSAIDSAETLEKLTNLAKRVEANKGIWPNSYVSQANERIMGQRLHVADERMAAKKDVDDLNNEFADLEAALEGVVHFDDLAAIHKKHEQRILG